MSVALVMKAIGELHSLPVEREHGVVVSFPLTHSASLAETEKGDNCPVALAEIAAPAWKLVLRTKFGVFIRREVEHWPMGSKHAPEIIQAWLRV